MILKLNDITYTAVDKNGDVVLKKCLSNVFSMNPLLPSRYIPLEYLKGRNITYSNGANILTGKVIKFSEGESIKVVFDLADVPSDNYRAVLGVGSSSTDDNLWILQDKETNSLSLYVKCQDKRKSFNLNDYIIPHKNEIIIDENGYSINGVDGTFSTKKLSDGTNTMSLFGTRSNPINITYTSTCKIYEYVHYDSDGEELMHLYPCLDSVTDKLGMYDTVDATFIQNSNQNVNFIDGPVTELSNGTIKSHSSGIYKYWTDADKQYIEGYCWAENGESM